MGAEIVRQTSQSKCNEPEETVRQAALAVIAAAIAAQDPASAVKVSASGSQSEKYDSNGQRTGVFTNSLSISIEPLYGFVE